jgi:UDP-2,4-diacetamido-2,4,6-trideoxy-beta-L-altropyranose hydrolase
MYALAATGIEVLPFDADATPSGEVAAMQARWPAGAALLVVDHYRRDATFETPLRPWAGRILAIDDLAYRPHDCDLLLDATLGRKPERYGGGAVPEGCRLLLGPVYALLKPDFAAARTASIGRRRTPVLRRVLVSFGSTDPVDATGACLEALALSGLAFDIDVVLGSAAPRLARVRQRVAKMPRARLHVETDNMAALMAAADIALGAAGGTSWERCCLGLPAFVAILAENQIGNAAALALCGAARVAGRWQPSLGQVMVRELGLMTAERLGPMAAAAAAVCDGSGIFRVADTIEQLLPPRT